MEKLHGSPASIKLKSGNVVRADEATIAGFWLHARKKDEHMSFPACNIVSVVWLDPK